MSLTILKARLSTALAPVVIGAGLALTPVDYSGTISNFMEGNATIAMSDAMAQARGGGTSDGDCGGCGGGGETGGNDNDRGGGDNDRQCRGTIEAAGTVNGVRAYRFSENNGNRQQNSSDGVFTSNREYRVGQTVTLQERHMSSLLDNIVWTNSTVRDASSCRVQLGEHWGEHQGRIGQGIPFVEGGQVSVRTTTVTGGNTTVRATTPVVPATPTPTAFYVTTTVNGRLCEGVGSNNDALQASYTRLSEPQHVNGYSDGRFTEAEVAAINSCDSQIIGLTKSFQNSCVFELGDVAGQRAFLRNNTCPDTSIAALQVQETPVTPVVVGAVTYATSIEDNCVVTTKSVGGVAESFTRSCSPAPVVTPQACASLIETTPTTRAAICTARP